MTQSQGDKVRQNQSLFHLQNALKCVAERGKHGKIIFTHQGPYRGIVRRHV